MESDVPELDWSEETALVETDDEFTVAEALVKVGPGVVKLLDERLVCAGNVDEVEGSEDEVEDSVAYGWNKLP